LKEEALDRTVSRARVGGGFGHVVRQATKLMNDKENRQPASRAVTLYLGCQLTSKL